MAITPSQVFLPPPNCFLMGNAPFFTLGNVPSLTTDIPQDAAFYDLTPKPLD